MRTLERAAVAAIVALGGLAGLAQSAVGTKNGSRLSTVDGRRAGDRRSSRVYEQPAAARTR